MPWTKTRYPVSMKDLPAAVRVRAIEIGNALLEDVNMEEGIAIATAVSRAKGRAVGRGITSRDSKRLRITDAKEHGTNRYVIPHQNEWAIKMEGKAGPEKTFRNKKDAVKQARIDARKVNGSLTIQKKTGQVEQKIYYSRQKGGAK